MKEIKWINAAEQKPAENQKVLALSKCIGTKTQQVSENICVFKNGHYWCDSAITVTRGEEFEQVAKVSWELIMENVFAWTDMETICASCELLKDMIKEEE